MALGQLYEDGKLDLDAPIQAYLPKSPEKEATITTRMLAGHLGGIRHYKNYDEFLSPAPYAAVSDALEIFKNDPVKVRPGTEYSYSTYGYSLISAVIESATNQDFLSYMTENVFGPIGMTHTVADHVVPIISNRSRFYRLQDGQLVNTPWVDNSNKWAGGGFLSTSEDLVRFGSAHLSDQFLHPETIKMMWTSQHTASGEETGYGIGWKIRIDDQGRIVVGHTGGSIGGTTNLRIYPKKELIIAVISNTSDAALGKMTDAIVEVFLREL
jgi:CubicO group peptidase (beta-lactamase class C family)